MFLFSSQNRPLWRHRHGRELGESGVIAQNAGSVRRLGGVLGRGFGFHGGGLDSTVELDGRWGVGGHTGTARRWARARRRDPARRRLGIRIRYEKVPARVLQNKSRRVVYDAEARAP